MNTDEYNLKLTKARKLAVEHLLSVCNNMTISHRGKGKESGKIPAIMFDIDDTLVNYLGEPHREIIRIYRIAKNLGFKIVVITARADDYSNQTQRELDSIGIVPDFLYLRSSEDNYNDFKIKKKDFLKNFYGIDIVLSIGDQWIDVNGKNSGYGIKLPSVQDKNLYVIKRKTSSVIKCA